MSLWFGIVLLVVLYVGWLVYAVRAAPLDTELWPPDGEPVSFVADTPHDRKRGES